MILIKINSGPFHAKIESQASGHKKMRVTVISPYPFKSHDLSLLIILSYIGQNRKDGAQHLPKLGRFFAVIVYLVLVFCPPFVMNHCVFFLHCSSASFWPRKGFVDVNLFHAQLNWV